MKNKYFILLFWGFIQFGNSQIPYWNKVGQFKNNLTFNISNVRIDLEQNKYISDSFKDSFKIENKVIYSKKNAAYLAKYSVDDKLIWLQKIAETDTDIVAVNAITFDITNNIILSIWSRKNIILNDSNFTFNGVQNSILVKLNSDGNFLKANHYLTTCWAGVLENCLKVSSNGDLIISGNYTCSLTIDTTTIHSVDSYEDIFVASLDSNLHLNWLKSYGNPQDDRLSSMTLDANDNIYLAGEVAILGTSKIDTVVFHYPLSSNSHIGFVAKLNPQGKGQWVKSFSQGSQWPETVYTQQLIWANDRLVLPIMVSSNASDPNLRFNDNYRVHYFASTDYVLIAIDSNGQYLWRKILNKSYYPRRISSLTSDLNGNIYGAGSFYNEIFIDSNDIHSSHGLQDILVVSLDPAGNPLWIKTAGGSGDDGAQSIAYKQDALYVVGSLGSTDCQFDNYQLNGLNGLTFFAKLSDTPNGIADFSAEKEVSVFPNPTNQHIFLKSKSIQFSTMILCDMQGKEVCKFPNLTSNSEQKIDLPFLESGLYFLHLISKEGSQIQKIIIQH